VSDETTSARAHLRRSHEALTEVEHHLPTIEAWAALLAQRLGAGHRLLAAGNGGSAALAEHLTAELVGRYDRDRRAFSAIPLHTDAATLTALVNDYGPDLMFARQVDAHGRPGDAFLGLSTSGRSPNVLHAIEAARTVGMDTWALTGPAPNPLAEASDSAVCIDAPTTAAVQEAHQVVVHLLCLSFDEHVVGGAP
jgi:D-sedoheptulose 7-phosphate isomerase